MGIESEVFSRFIPTKLREMRVEGIGAVEVWNRIYWCQLFRVIKEINR